MIAYSISDPIKFSGQKFPKLILWHLFVKFKNRKRQPAAISTNSTLIQITLVHTTAATSGSNYDIIVSKS